MIFSSNPCSDTNMRFWGKEGGREGEREGGRERGREGGRKGGKNGRRERMRRGEREMSVRQVKGVTAVWLHRVPITNRTSNIPVKAQ